MNNNYTDITILLDRSGSMVTIWPATIAGLNTFISEQKVVPAATPPVDNTVTARPITFDLNEGQPVRCKLTLILFARGCYHTVINAQDIDTVDPIPVDRWQPSGGTPLWLSMCRCIDETGARFAAMEEKDRPGRVIFVTVTDGEETEYTPPVTEVRAKVEHQEKNYNWQFIYQGANQNAILTASEMGISANNSMCYAASNAGATLSYSHMSDTILRKRSVDPQFMTSTGYLAEQYQEADRALISVGAMTNAQALGIGLGTTGSVKNPNEQPVKQEVKDSITDVLSMYGVNTKP